MNDEFKLRLGLFITVFILATYFLMTRLSSWEPPSRSDIDTSICYRVETSEPTALPSSSMTNGGNEAADNATRTPKPKKVKRPPSTVQNDNNGKAAGGKCYPIATSVRSRIHFPKLAVEIAAYVEGKSVDDFVDSGKKFRVLELGAQKCWLSREWLSTFHALYPEMTVEYYIVDAWGRRPDPEPGLIDNNDDVEGFAHFLSCYQLLSKVEGVVFHRGFSAEAAELYQDEFFDMIFIDALHTYEMSLLDMQTWYPKLKPGRLLAGDDHGDAAVCRTAGAKKVNPGLCGHFINYKWGVVRATSEFSRTENLPIFRTTLETHYSAIPLNVGENWYTTKPPVSVAACFKPVYHAVEWVPKIVPLPLGKAKYVKQGNWWTPENVARLSPAAGKKKRYKTKAEAAYWEELYGKKSASAAVWALPEKEELLVELKK